MKKIDAKKQPGLAALKKKRPEVVKKMGYMKKGGMAQRMMGGGMMDPNKKMMGGGMMGYSMGGEVLAKVDEVIKMPTEIATPKAGQTLEIPVKGHKNYKGTVKIS